jgi:MYXO-CTERM domain-containing protein
VNRPARGVPLFKRTDKRAFMSRLLTFVSTMGPALAIVFGVASTSTASASSVYDLTLTQNYAPIVNAGNGSGTLTIGETLPNGKNEPFTGDDDISITIGGITFGPQTLFTDTANVANGQVTGIEIGDLSYFNGEGYIDLNLADSPDSYYITYSAYDNAVISAGTYSLALVVPPSPTVTPLPSSISLILGGAGVLGLALLLGRRNRREHDASESFSAA